ARENHGFSGQTAMVGTGVCPPDGKYLASGSGYGRDRNRRVHGVPAFTEGTKEYTVRLWDLEGLKEYRCYNGHERVVQGVAFTPDSRRVLSASVDGTVRLWDVASGKQLQSFVEHTKGVKKVV